MTASEPATTIEELVRLSAFNSELFNRTFFPRTFRQASPPFAKEIDDALDDPSVRLLCAEVFRGGGKTTRARAFTAKRIAYGLSRTILYVSANEGHAMRSIRWLRAQVERNKLYAGTFNLAPGSKWHETEIEVQHQSLGHPIFVLGVGITGNIRGINFEDYRPDTIILDDILTDENVQTLEQREKISDLVFGALKNSLAPVVDDPNAKMVMIVTSQHREDVAAQARKDRQFKSIVAPCWTPETMNAPIEKQESVWPLRYPSEDLRRDKLAAIERNKLSTFAREMELRLVSSEQAEFRAEWLQYYNAAELPRGAHVVYAIDPVPPPSDRELAKGMRGKDWEVHHVWGRWDGAYYLLDARRNRGHDPNWSVATFFELGRRWRPAKVVVESVAYQRVLKWMLEKEMQRRRTYYSIIDPKDRRPKFVRITSTLSGIASQGQLFVQAIHGPFIQQFIEYGTTADHDDELDAAAMALSELINPYLEYMDAKDLMDLDEGVESFEYIGAAP